MLKMDEKQVFKELVDRSLMILVLKCSECGAIVAQIEHPQTAKLDQTCDQHDHFKETGHSSYKALKHLIVYMCKADKALANELSETQRKAFENFVKTLEEKGVLDNVLGGEKHGEKNSN